jgi:ATP-dependent exoDNAse (exonuclease V) beta subunit
LEAVKIPVAGVDLVSLAELPVVRDLTALARALDHLGDRTAWLAVLRAPWCGLTLLELTALLDRSTHSTVWEIVNDASRVDLLDAAARLRLLRAREVLAHALADRERLEPSRWVERTWLRLGGPAACSNDEDLDHAQAFFNAFERWSTAPDWVGPLGLEEQLTELYAVHEGAPESAVQIMTIHRSKGLEFDKVIVPGLGRRLRATTEPLLRWLELPRDPEGSDLLMAPIGSSDRRVPEPLNEYLKSLQARRSANERSRLMYVAATRARSELHLFGELPPVDTSDDPSELPSPKPRTGTLLATLWPAIAADFPAKPDSQTRADENASQSTVPVARAVQSRSMRLQRLPTDWRLPDIPAAPSPMELLVATYEPDEAPITGATETDRAIHLVVHEQFRRYTRQGALPPRGHVSANPRVLRERLTRLGLAPAELEEALERTVDVLEACAADSRARWIFSPAHTQVVSPLELTGVYEGRLASIAIDRSFIDTNGTRWLINFESAAPLDGDVESFLARELQRRRPELERQIAFARVSGSDPVRAALYFPLLCAFCELP